MKLQAQEYKLQKSIWEGHHDHCRLMSRRSANHEKECLSEQRSIEGRNDSDRYGTTRGRCMVARNEVKAT